MASSLPEETSVRSTSIEPITSTEPTTTPRQETEGPDQHMVFSNTEPDQSHIQHIPLRDEHAESSGADDATTEMQRQREQDQQQNELNQISNEQDDVVKDLNNFRHPATLITASNSNSEENVEIESDKQVETTTTAAATSTSTEATGTPPTGTPATSTSTVPNEREEDPYHVHILSENHDRLAEHEDYQMLSTSTEESSTTSTTSTTNSTTESGIVAGIVVSQENKATAEPSTATESTSISTSTTTAATAATSTTSRARAMHMNDPEDEAATTIMPDSESVPVINIVEGQHMLQQEDQKDEEEEGVVKESESSSTTEASTTTTEPSPFVAFAGEGRSAGGGNDIELFLHHNGSTHEQLMDLSDVSMDGDQNEGSSKTESSTTSTTTTTAQPETEMPKIVEITASGDTMQRECLANNKSYKVRIKWHRNHLKLSSKRFLLKII